MGKPKKGGGRGGAKDSGPPKQRRQPGKDSFTVKDLDIEGSSDEEGQGLDAFQQRRDKVSLQASDDFDDSDDELEEGVMDLPSSDEGDEEGEEDDDALLEEAIQKGGRIGLLARQAKQMAQKLKLSKGAESSDEDDEDEEEAGAKGKRGKRTAGDEDDDADMNWGANKRAYYDDGSEEPEDEEDARAEEEEVKRLQKAAAKRTTAADYGVDDSDEDEDDGSDDEEEEEEDTMEAAAKKASKKDGAAKPGKVAVETVTRQLDALTADQRTAALLADAPELSSLIEELTTALSEVRHRVGPLVTEVRSGKLATREGLSYLEAKHLLLLQYALHIVFYLLLKAEGKSVKDHPVINRLVEIRAYLEKIRPIDKQLSYQIDKLLRAAAAAQAADGTAPKPATLDTLDGQDVADEDELAAAPRPSELRARAGGVAGRAAGDPEAAGGSVSGVYRPPRLNPVTMEDDAERRKVALSREDRRQLAEVQRRAGRSEALADLAAEVAGAPEELRSVPIGFDTLGALKMRQKLEARSAEEEDAFIRVPLSRDQAKALKAQRRAGFSTAAIMGDFADEVADLVGVSSEGGRPGGLTDVFARQKVAQKFGGELDRPITHGGDTDLPRRADLGERRAKYDALAAKRAAQQQQQQGGDSDGYGDGGSDDEYDDGGGRRGGKRGSPDGEEDDFYTQAKESAAARKRARSELHHAPALLPPLPDQEVGDRARPINNTIQKNRGLTPHRRKDLKNPRKHQRVKYSKALVRRAGAVQDGAAGRSTGHAAYAGEATGVKSRVTKSRRL